MIKIGLLVGRPVLENKDVFLKLIEALLKGFFGETRIEFIICDWGKIEEIKSLEVLRKEKIEIFSFDLKEFKPDLKNQDGEIWEYTVSRIILWQTKERKCDLLVFLDFPIENLSEFKEFFSIFWWKEGKTKIFFKEEKRKEIKNIICSLKENLSLKILSSSPLSFV